MKSSNAKFSQDKQERIDVILRNENGYEITITEGEC
jgi:hypothetical protein